MKPEAQRIAIAEACGFKRHGNGEHWASFGGSIAGYVDNALTPLPNYPEDLNACREMEKVLKAKSLFMVYNDWLNKIPDGETPSWHASADQRAEAFLRTLGLWIESEAAA